MSKTMESNNSTKYDIDNKLNGQERYDQYRHQRLFYDEDWYKRYNEYLQYLNKSGSCPTLKTNSSLYQWYTHQKSLLKKRTLDSSRVSSFCSLVDKVDEIKRRKKERKEEKKQKEKEEKIRQKEDALKASSLLSQPQASQEIPGSQPIETKKKAKRLGNDDLWNSKWQAYVDYMNEHGCRPSKHHKEDMVLFDWFKHNKKLLNQGKLRTDRIKKFKQLLVEAKDLQRINQHRYVNGKTAPKVEHKQEIHLYDFQEDMKERIQKAFQTYQSVMVQMPTGTGKTHLVASVVRDFVQKGVGKVWLVAHRQELVTQLKETMAKYLDKDEMSRIVVKSIQWLSRNIGEIEESPSLIVIDEAHHALAKTYSGVMNRFPHAKKLGVTATPYRLSGEGFTGLFEILLTSWDIKTFIKKGYLSPYDYYSIANNSIELMEINSLRQRGADGDYLNMELDKKFNEQKFIERLFDTYKRFAYGKKGFVYAINIKHAENIAEYYRRQGIKAAAVSSKTPKKERERLIKAFKDNELAVLCSVDLFSEGFNSPDAEFVQLARPTLSLAKYLQMVGRGLRVAPGKKVCIILDNVGLERLFGEPDSPRNWQAWFEGLWSDVNDRYIDLDGEVDLSLHMHVGPPIKDMYLSSGYSREKKNEAFIKQYRLVTDDNDKKGIVAKGGKEVVPCIYDKIERCDDGIVQLVSEKKEPLWFDLLNKITYNKKPITDYVGEVPIAIVGDRYYPRLDSKWINDDNYIPFKQMKIVCGEGLDWTCEIDNKQVHYYIPWSGKPRLYRIISEEKFGFRILDDENGKQYVQQNPDSSLQSLSNVTNLDEYIQKCKQTFLDFGEQAKKSEPARADVERFKRNGYFASLDSNKIYHLSDKSKVNPDFWVDSLTSRIFRTKPIADKRGAVKLIRVGDFVYVRDNRIRYPYQDWQIKADDKHFWIINKDFEVK